MACLDTIRRRPRPEPTIESGTGTAVESAREPTIDQRRATSVLDEGDAPSLVKIARCGQSDPSVSARRFLGEPWGEFSVRGPPNAWVWGGWMLRPGASGEFTGITCAYLHPVDIRMDRYTSHLFLVFGGGSWKPGEGAWGGSRWNFTAMEGRVRGTGGVLYLRDNAQVRVESRFGWNWLHLI
jgi:hypothetical protein